MALAVRHAAIALVSADVYTWSSWLQVVLLTTTSLSAPRYAESRDPKLMLTKPVEVVSVAKRTLLAGLASCTRT
jgi:hypothetical protein